MRMGGLLSQKSQRKNKVMVVVPNKTVSSATFSLTPEAQRKSLQKETPRISRSAERDQRRRLCKRQVF
jgi:hypothetical protein